MTWVEPAAEDEVAWLRELDLDPSSSWLAMGTRALGDQPWLIADPQRSGELAIRRRLIDERSDEVLVVPAAAEHAVAELAAMLEAEGVVLDGPDVPPAEKALAGGLRGTDLLARIGRSVQEDICLLRRGEVEWELEAGVLCFPSRWSLPDRVGRPLREVHGPTEGFDPVLADRITSLLDRLDDRIVRRRNWFVHPDPALFQPVRPVGGDPLVPTEQVLDGLFVRSERQTLRALPATGRVVFTIRIQQCRLRRAFAEHLIGEQFIEYLRHAPIEQLVHRGMSAEQRSVILDAVD